MKPLDEYYEKLEEPVKSCMLALRDFILKLDDKIEVKYKFAMPFFYYQGKMFCYTRIFEKTQKPYLSIEKGHLIDHPQLELGDRKKYKIYWLNCGEDLEFETIEEVLREAMSHY